MVEYRIDINESVSRDLWKDYHQIIYHSIVELVDGESPGSDGYGRIWIVRRPVLCCRS